MSNRLNRFLFTTVAAAGLALSARAQANSSANLDAHRDVAASAHFLVDTNRTFPMLFIVGDSTVHNPGRGERGWGDLLAGYFQTNRIRVENHALGGRSSRTFQTQGWWDKVLQAAKPGDFVLVQMGHNDAGALNDTNRARGSIRSLGEETQEIDNLLTHQHEVVHTYGWYMRKYISDARAHGMTPILCTPVPHCPKQPVQPGEEENSVFVKMAAAVATDQQALLIPLNRLVMTHYATNTPAGIKQTWFTPADNTHSSPAGAQLNAECVVEGLRTLTNCPLRDYLRPE